MRRTLVAAAIFSVFSTVAVHAGRAQAPTPDPTPQEIITAINEQVWIPFCESFAQNDADSFLALHTADAVRVTALPKDVKIGDAFREETSTQMQQFKSAGMSFTLTLRFTLRANSGDAAFETGAYRFESKTGGQVGYGKFQALLRRIDGRWKVALDSDEPADAAAFDEARALEDTDWE